MSKNIYLSYTKPDQIMDFETFAKDLAPIRELIRKEAFSEEYFLNLRKDLTREMNGLNDLHIAKVAAWAKGELYALGTSPISPQVKPRSFTVPPFDFMDWLHKKIAGEITAEEYEEELQKQLDDLDAFFRNDPAAGRPQFPDDITAGFKELLNDTRKIPDKIDELYTQPFRTLRKARRRYWLNRCGYWLVVTLVFFGTIFIERVVDWMARQGFGEKLIGEILAAFGLTFFVDLGLEEIKGLIFWRIAKRFFRDFEKEFEMVKQHFDKIPPVKPVSDIV